MKRVVLIVAILAMAVSAERERRILFTVRHVGKQTLLDPVILLDPLEAPPIDGTGGTVTDHQRAPEFIKRYFEPGRTYHVIGGGTVTVVRHDDPGGCADMWAQATTSAAGMLASNDPSLRAHRVEKTTAGDERSAQALAAEIFAEHHVRNRVGQHSSTALVTVADGTNPLLIATFEAESADHGTLWGIFVIAHRDGASWRREHVEFVDTKAESVVGHRSFAGNVDLDGDGVDELIVSTQGIEGYGYAVMQRRHGSWDVIAAGGGAGC